jgi:hypothetical protein
MKRLAEYKRIDRIDSVCRRKLGISSPIPYYDLSYEVLNV